MSEALKWVTDEAVELPVRDVLSLDSDLTISVSSYDSNGRIVKGKTWGSIHLLSGKILERSLDESRALWPREAIAIARQKLDDLEKKLNE